MNKKLLWILVLVLTILIIWAPWITKNYAQNKVTEKFNSKWEGVNDGCGFNCENCGIKKSNRTFLGYKVEIEFACGMKLTDSPESHNKETFYVSLFGTVYRI